MRVLTAAVLAASCGLPTAWAQAPEVIYSEVATAPLTKREVPGLPGQVFESTTVGFALRNPILSPNGQRWIIGASSNLATTEDDVILVGSGTTGQLVAREGTPTPFDALRNWGTFDLRVSINDAGSFVFTSNISDPTTDDELVAKYDLVAGVPTWVANPYREGVVAADAGVTPFIPAGARYGVNIDSANILADGNVAARVELLADAALGITTNNNDCLYISGVALQRETNTSPNGQTVFWDLFDFDGFRTSADGSVWAATGNDENNTAPSLDQVFVINNDVIIREGQILPGLTTATNTGNVAQFYLAYNGDWLARGSNTNADEDWVVRNGPANSVVLLANALGGATQDITPASPSGELWTDTDFAACFFAMSANTQGDYIIGGVTNAASNRNGVVVLNGETVILREGDPVDLDGNGQFDDNVFYRTFGDDSFVLTDDGWLYFRASVTNDPLLGNTGPDLGDNFMRVRLTQPCYANCDASTNPPVLNALDFSCFLTRYNAGDPYANCDGSTNAPILNALDFSCFLNAYRNGCP